jgi:hypothetical protein
MLVGVIAITASQGSVTSKALELRPIYRIGQLYETVPGLVVTVHSGESKANQYLLRGFDLDHGTDFASFVDGMPVNRGTNAHGQGYSDQNFLMPQIVGGLDYTKGPYFAAIGDFGAVGSAHVHLLDDLPEPGLGQRRHPARRRGPFAGGTYHFDAGDRIWGAVELATWTVPGIRPATSTRSTPPRGSATAMTPTATASPPCTTRAPGGWRPTSRSTRSRRG